jgi:hypothetical protein
LSALHPCQQDLHSSPCMTAHPFAAPAVTDCALPQFSKTFAQALDPQADLPTYRTEPGGEQ